jgi:hypothetical protein
MFSFALMPVTSHHVTNITPVSLQVKLLCQQTGMWLSVILCSANFKMFGPDPIKTRLVHPIARQHVTVKDQKCRNYKIVHTSRNSF